MTFAVPNLEHKYSVEEFFDLLKKSEHTYEFHDGLIRMMAGGTSSHAKIKGDVYTFLSFAARSGKCQPFDSDMAVSIPKWNSYVFPDISFTCEKDRYDDQQESRLSNPSLLIEVLSESSESYDRGEKFWKYRSLDSFREYMLIDSRRYAVECWYKEDDKIWRMDSAFNRDESVYLHTLKVELSLEEIYRRVFFDD